MATTTTNGPSEGFPATTATTSSGGNGGAAAAQSSTNSPEEIAWYFVESYYTTLNRYPERLHLFHQKKSSFVWGTEGDNVPVSQGRQEISERIKDMTFKDCKVRVNNVDSQASLNSGIIVQVLGAMTNNSEPSRRFSQTFFLAEQTSPQGYYVLNDIFRYLKEDDEEDIVETAQDEEPEAAAVEEPEVPAPAPVSEEEEVVAKEETPAAEAEKAEETPVEPEAEKVEEPAPAPVVPAVPVIPAVPTVPVAQAEPVEPETANLPHQLKLHPPPPLRQLQRLHRLSQIAASAYVRSSTGKINLTSEQLKSALSVYGAIHRADIVNENRHAFVDFTDAAGLIAAAAANPHRIGDQTIFIEERRPRPPNYAGRGGPSLRGGERQGSRGSQRGPGGDRDRFDSSRNSIGGGRGQGGGIRGGGQFQRGARGSSTGAASSN
ncbi:hypothetical protein DRE_07527 [Drechslerella stenobrocha 248]|uniref:NTF2 domain-containing protein n=1 Tax=Drechslerella stenobrocha 248 TaxID=1043628 RepID=W7I453_9PEZI|nr:hypothetical protein DRE_07527 [Drechslerella stenobrocha 248]